MIFSKVKRFQVLFDSPDADCAPVFSSGDVVSGRVVLELCADTAVQSLKLHAEGYAKVHWTESRSAGSSTAYTQNYSDEVEYLNRREVLLQAGVSLYMCSAQEAHIMSVFVYSHTLTPQCTSY